MNKNTRTLFTLFTLLCASGVVKADIERNNNAFLYGDNVEIGIGPDGVFGADIKSAEGESDNSPLGFISFPTGDANAHNGDFILDPKGGDEAGWGVSFDGNTYNNNNSDEAQIEGTFSDFKSTETIRSVVWKGEVDGLEITKVFRIYKSGTAVITDVSLKNTTSSEMKEVYYMHTINPQNNAEYGSKYETINKILSQGSDGSGKSVVSASQEGSEGNYSESILTLSGYGDNSRVTYGGDRNRDPVAVYNGDALVNAVGSTREADESISIAFKYDSLLPGDTVRLRTGYQLADVVVPNIDIDGDDSSGATGSEFKQTYFLGSSASRITDTDVLIEGTDLNQLNEAIITLTNPHEGDLLEVSGTLPDGITLETLSDTELKLLGVASLEDYQTALSQFQFSNSKNTKDADVSIEARKVTLQLIDQNATPSNAATSTIEMIIPLELDSQDIAGDNLINDSEDNDLSFSGHAAPNAEVKIEFTDKDGKKLDPVKTLQADENGNWTLINNPADLSTLSDGPIVVNVTAKDVNENIATLNKEILKDTNIILNNITPIDNELVSTTTPTYSGKTDPKAKVLLKVLPDGKEYSETADENGDWSILLDKFPMGVTQSVKITAEDEAENQKTATLIFKTPNLPIEVTDLDANADGLAHSTAPTLKGTSNPNTTITINMPTSNGKTSSCTATTDNEGKWTCKLSASPTGGPYTATVTTTDAGGNQNVTTRQLSIPDLSLAISSPANDELVSTTMPAFTGTTDPEATVTLEVLPAGKSYTVTADATGKWTVPLDDDLPKGETVSVKVTAKDVAGNESTLTQTVRTPGLPIAVTDLDANAQGMASSTTPTIKGTSDPNTSIKITMPTTAGNVTSCETTTDADGNWSCTLPVSPSGGPYTLTSVTTDAGGNTNSTTSQLSIPVLPLIVDSPENKAVISGVDPIVSGTSKPGMKITVNLSDGKTCSATTDNTNHWHCQLPTLPSGEDFKLTVTTEDEAGNTTTKVSSFRTDKLPLSISAPKDNSTVEDSTPIFTGTTAPNTDVTVTVIDEDGQKCSTKSDSEGRWSCELPELSVGGPYDVTIKAKDSAGNETSLNEKISVPKVDLTVTNPKEGESIKEVQTAFTGTSDPSKPITVQGPDGELCETVSDENGEWRCELDNLQPGKNKRFVVYTDGENDGKKMKLLNINIDNENSSDKVKTILKGGGGSSSLPILLVFALLSFFTRYRKK